MSDKPRLPANWHGSRCGHNFEILACPYDGCVARELYEALVAQRTWQVAIATVGCHPRVGADAAELADAALAKARGETP